MLVFVQKDVFESLSPSVASTEHKRREEEEWSNCSTLELHWDEVIKSLVTNSCYTLTHTQMLLLSGRMSQFERQRNRGGKQIKNKQTDGRVANNWTRGNRRWRGGGRRTLITSLEMCRGGLSVPDRSCCPRVPSKSARWNEMSGGGRWGRNNGRWRRKVRVVINLQSQHRSRINSTTLCSSCTGPCHRWAVTVFGFFTFCSTDWTFSLCASQICILTCWRAFLCCS